jgi:O-antigen/teichoic acid export membrane protein
MFKLSPYLTKVFYNISWLTLDQMIRMGINTFVGILIARYLGVAQFGAYNYALAFIMIFSPMITFGFDGFIIRDFVANPDKKAEILGSCLLVRLMGAVIAISLVHISISLIKSSPTDQLTRIITDIVVITFIFQPFDVVDLMFRAQLKSKYTVWSKTSAFLLASALKILCLIFHLPLIAFAILYVFEVALGAVGMIALCSNRIGLNLKVWYATIDRMFYILKEGWPLLLSNTSAFLYSRIDQILIGWYLGDAAVGIYAASTKLYEMGLIFILILYNSFFPMLHDLYHRDKELFYKRYALITDLYTVIGYLTLAFVLVFSKQAVLLTFGKGFNGTSDILNIQIFGLLILCNASLRSMYMAITSSQKILLRFTLGAALLNIILNLILIPKFGIKGSAVATVITYVFGHLIMNVFFKETRRLFYIQIRSFIPTTLFRVGFKWLLARV